GVTNPIEGFGITQCGLAVIFMVILLVSDMWTRETPGVEMITRKPLVLRWAGYYALVVTILLTALWSMDTGSSPFIYFTF
ncbi:MAG: MBOAT family protein, partial [Treponema sp.]|nr:MBOAT family protein [Treponema sp.]